MVYLDHLFLCWFCQRLQRLVQANRGKKHIINYLIKYLINVGTRLDILKLFTLILAKGKGDKINRDNSQSGTCWNLCLFNLFWIPTMTITKVREFLKKWICCKTKVHTALMGSTIFGLSSIEPYLWYYFRPGVTHFGQIRCHYWELLRSASFLNRGFCSRIFGIYRWTIWRTIQCFQ